MPPSPRAEADVLVVGGGPAGASAATLLARAGLDVLLLDRAHFPRPKACAEFLSPQAARVLERLDVLGDVERAAPARLTGLVVRAPGGALVRGDYVAAHGHRAHRDYAFSLPRTTLDPLLLARARRDGVRVLEGMQVTALRHDDTGRVTGARARAGGDTVDVRAALVVGADGLRSIVARRLGLARRARWPRRLGLTAHYRGVADVGEVGEMHVERDGFVGIADVGSGLANVSLVVPAGRGRDARGDAAGFLHRWLMARPHLARR
ncbi:MAG TPA: FAD-dependent oxidoreductase, partial [Gemmatimonadaceae bacterium]|nr:FAD-dependent oxidoreductase [Gemmatimonadaceae bacterium]